LRSLPVARRRRRSSRVSHDRWLVSYADFITLLFAFFAMMYAVSSVDARKLEVAADGLREAFAAAHVPSGSRVVSLDDGGAADADRTTDEIEATLRSQLAPELQSSGLSLRVGRRGVILSIPEAGSFATGNDELSPVAATLINRVASVIDAYPNPVRVEGHADNLPISTLRFRSNWDLSASRASRVVELLIRAGVEPSRLAATGYAEFQPVTANSDEVARATNRRVDLVILNQASDMPEPPQERALP
jgi:chemotaxis protein MotB